MKYLFAPKSASHVANAITTIQWSGADFQRHIGKSVIDMPVSVSLRIKNDTSQAIYVGLRYETQQQTYELLESRNIASVAAGSTVEITSLNAPRLARLEPGIVAISCELRGLASGNVTAGLTVDNETQLIAPASQFGADAPLQRDYTEFSLFDKTDVAPGIASYVLFEHSVTSYTSCIWWIRINTTPSWSGQCFVELEHKTAPAGTLLYNDYIYSSRDETVRREGTLTMRGGEVLRAVATTFKATDFTQVSYAINFRSFVE